MVVNFFDDARAEADEADRTIENLNGDEVEEVFIIFIRDLHKFFLLSTRKKRFFEHRES